MITVSKCTHYILNVLIKSYLGLVQSDQINWMLTLSVITLGGFHCSIIWLIKLSEIITLLRISLNLVNYYTKWLQHFYLFCIIISIIWNSLKKTAPLNALTRSNLITTSEKYLHHLYLIFFQIVFQMFAFVHNYMGDWSLCRKSLCRKSSTKWCWKTPW